MLPVQAVPPLSFFSTGVEGVRPSEAGARWQIGPIAGLVPPRSDHFPEISYFPMICRWWSGVLTAGRSRGLSLFPTSNLPVDLSCRFSFFFPLDDSLLFKTFLFDNRSPLPFSVVRSSSPLLRLHFGVPLSPLSPFLEALFRRAWGVQRASLFQVQSENDAPPASPPPI